VLEPINQRHTPEMVVKVGGFVDTVYLPFVKWLLVSVLVVLSTVKFMFVIFYFMHLRWDRVFCTLLFFIGLVLAAATMWALLKLFGAEAGKPLYATMIDPPAIVARIA